MDEVEVRRRPGGRSARVRREVLDATVQLLETGGLDALTVAAVADLAGVHETTIYRRWGTVEALMLDALLSTTGAMLPMPDTGTLRADLIAYATSLAAFLQSPLGLAVNRALAVSGDEPAVAQARTRFWETRIGMSSQMIVRAVARGELPAGTDALLALEIVLAPLHMRALLTRDPIDPPLPEQLVDTALAGLRNSPPR